jgi:hypothetical protein
VVTVLDAPALGTQNVSRPDLPAGIGDGQAALMGGSLRESAKHATVTKAISGSFRNPDLVKGYGYVGGQQPIDDYAQIIEMLGDAKSSMAEETLRGYYRPDDVAKSISPEFQRMWAAGLKQAPGGMGQWMAQITAAIQALGADLGKNFSLTSPLGTGFVPFNLLAPSRLIYPFYSPMRNKLPRTAGQGGSLRTKLIVGIQGSQTGGANGAPKSMFISEFPGGGSFANWPNQLPPSGAQVAADLNLPYSFQGITESVSWPAQFEGQGYEDLSGLANLILMQEAMLAEEYQLLASTSHAIGAPSAAPSLTARTAGAGETALSGVTTNIYVYVTATNYTGETTPASVANIGVSAGQVVDVTINGQPLAALQYNIYVGTGASNPGVGSAHLMATGVGGVRYTLMGALPTSTAVPPTADTGTGQTNAYEGMMSVSSGWAAANSVYPSGFLGGYVNKNAGTTLSLAIVNAALEGMWNGGTTNTGFGGVGWTSAGGFRVNPAELIAEGTDVTNLSQDIVTNRASQNYLFTISQDQVNDITAGAAVSHLVNPVTRQIVRILVHPWLTQGTAFLNTYNLSETWANVSNVWEVNNVQDYLSISWPVIDMTFRYSLALLGALVCFAPQYNGVISGLQKSATTPYS